MELSLADRARALAVNCRTGCLCTNSHKLPGFPFGSMLPVALDSRVRPIFLLSTLAMHTQNLQQDPRASLLLADPAAQTEPLTAARLTLLGEVRPVPPDEVRETYLAVHKNAQAWQSFGDFAYYRLEPTAAYFIAGFGVMGWISAENWQPPL